MIVVDASCVVDALVEIRSSGPEARAVLTAHRDVAAPDFIDAEVASGLRGRWLGGELSDAAFAAAMEDLADLPVARYVLRGLVARAFGLRASVTPYDACYIGLAELPSMRTSTPVTGD